MWENELLLKAEDDKGGLFLLSRADWERGWKITAVCERWTENFFNTMQGQKQLISNYLGEKTATTAGKKNI